MEEWRDIKGYEGLYQVSSWGRVKSLNYNHTGKERILLQWYNKGYNRIGLVKNGILKMYSVHRLVAEAFIPNPNNLPFVNHKDENKQNNIVSNLEWCNIAYNNSYGTRTERASKKQINRKDCSKVILQYDLYGNFIKEWASTKEIERQLGYSHSNISKCCNGKYKSACGYKWKYK